MMMMVWRWWEVKRVAWGWCLWGEDLRGGGGEGVGWWDEDDDGDRGLRRWWGWSMMIMGVRAMGLYIGSEGG